MSSNKKYWKSVEELKENSSIVETLKQNEFVEEIPTDEFLGDKATLQSSSTSRRDFLKYVGFSTAAASLAACEGPVIKSIPYVVQPTEIIPGVANYYATTIADGFDFASVLVKTREGRPIKIERNDLATVNESANARVNASVLGLYDSLRVKGPMKAGEKISWGTFDIETNQKLTEVMNAGKEIVLLTQTFASPSTTKLISEFKTKYGGRVRHVIYDAVSESAVLDAYEAKYGKRGLANYDFSKAEVIVSVGADFLGDWQGGGFDSGYSKGRIPSEGKMSRHIQFESNMTLSGANADKRVPVTPSQQKLVLAKLYSKLNGGSASGELPQHIEEAIDKAAQQLQKAGSKGVIVTGLPDVNAQTLVLEMNRSSEVFDAQTTIKTRQGKSEAVVQLMNDLSSGSVGALIMSGVNPLYSLPDTEALTEALKNQDLLSICFSQKLDETAKASQYVAAAPHYLESWGDTEFKTGHFGITQPTIRPLFDTRQFQDALLKWSGSDKTYREYIKETWGGGLLGSTSFNKAVQDGVFKSNRSLSSTSVASEAATSATASLSSEDDSEETPTQTTSRVLSGSAAARELAASATSEGMELSLYTKTGMGDGQQANNPWLQEFPDPITRASWDNYLTVSAADAERLELFNENVANGALNGSYADVTVDGTTIKNVPVIVQPGQAKGSVGLALGYGRKDGLKEEMQTGVNAYPLYKAFSSVQNVSIKKAAGTHEFACVQLQNTLMGRGDIIKETTLEIFRNNPKEVWNPIPKVSLNHVETPVTSPEVDLWDEFDRSIGHHFNLSIDLNACTGCGACVIACHAENNVPVVGKTEVRRSRDMHWLRIDRYYSS